MEETSKQKHNVSKVQTMRKRWYKIGGCGSKLGIFYTESDRPILLTTFFTRMKAFFVWCLTARARTRGRSF